VDVAEATGNPSFASVGPFLTGGAAAWDAARQAASGEGREYESADFGPAIPSPGQILCLGLNYSEHVREGGRDMPSLPDAFMRSGETVLAPYADLVRSALTERFDFEGELGIVIGAGGRYIPADKAMDAIAGFTVLNDASARDWQRAAPSATGPRPRPTSQMVVDIPSAVEFFWRPQHLALASRPPRQRRDGALEVLAGRPL
jgi:acylpyruvate hydrolase